MYRDGENIAYRYRLKTYCYDAFGNEQNLEKLDSNPFRYCGEYFNKETGEIYLRARYYNPATGRFGAEDSARSGLNWYTYCDNNPVSFYDPTGCYLVVKDREILYGNELGNYTGTYSVVQDSEMAALAAAGLSVIPYIGNAKSERVFCGPINGDIQGGSSVVPSLVKSIFSGTVSTSIDKKLLEPMRKTTNTPDVLGFIGALQAFAERDEIALQDQIYFGMMDIAKLPKKFNSLDDLNNQMSMLESYVKANPDYFTGIGGGALGAKFYDDYMLYRMSPKRRQNFLMDQAGLSVFEIYNPKKYPDKAGWAKYRELNRGYNQRISGIQSAFSK